jgi:hypothetical protein
VNPIRIYLSLDLDHDADLLERLVEESHKPGAGFEIAGRSQAGSASGGDEALRRRICEADEVIVICGEHTEGSANVSAEVRIAQEEEKPYFLLWGRREVMCTRPSAAKPGDGMYSWTASIIRDQIAMALRKSRPIEVPQRLKRS